MYKYAIKSYTLIIQDDPLQGTASTLYTCIQTCAVLIGAPFLFVLNRKSIILLGGPAPTRGEGAKTGKGSHHNGRVRDTLGPRCLNIRHLQGRMSRTLQETFVHICCSHVVMLWRATQQTLKLCMLSAIYLYMLYIPLKLIVTQWSFIWCFQIQLKRTFNIYLEHRNVKQTLWFNNNKPNVSFSPFQNHVWEI